MERRAATATVAYKSKQEEDEQTPHIRRTPTLLPVVELLGASTEEYGLRMSMGSGVPLCDPGTMRESAFGELRYQADVNNDAKAGRLMVDRDEHRTNYKLWVELLRFRQRLDGLAGVIEVWHGMRRRDIDLPTAGEEAEVLWEDFIDATSARTAAAAREHEGPERMRHELFDHAVDLKHRTGAVYQGLYKSLVGNAFRLDVAAGRFWYRKVLGAGLVPTEDALKLVVQDILACPQIDANVNKNFGSMYKHASERNCYDVVIPAVVRVRGTDLALRWHRLLITNGDGPSKEVFDMPAVQELFRLDEDRSLPMVHAAKRPEEVCVPSHLQLKDDEDAVNSAMTQSEQRATHDPSSFAPISRATMSSLVGDVHGIKPKENSDSFIAKLFATRAFSLDLLIRGLPFFGVDTLGPLAVREMVVRAGSAVELCNKLNELRAAGIAIVDTAYSRLVQKLATDGHTKLFDALLSSDQHPDGFADTATQEALLVQYLAAGEWAQAHVTMTCLSLAGVAVEGRAHNRLAQHYLFSRSWRLAKQTIESMRQQNLPLTSDTIAYLQQYLLPERRRGKRPVVSQRHGDARPPFDALAFVTNAYMYTDTIRGGSGVYPVAWIELLKRCGMAFRFDDLSKLVLWLAHRYGSHGREYLLLRRGRGRTMQVPLQRKLEEIFSKQMQAAIVAWGFNAAAVRNQLDASYPGQLGAASVGVSPTVATELQRHPPWTQGLRLLRQLRASGVPVSDAIVREAFYTRMWILFGPGYSTKRINDLARDLNELKLSEYIRHANAAYDGKLVVGVNDKLLDDDSQDQAILKLAFFGGYRKMWTPAAAKNERREYVDVAVWTSGLLAGNGEGRQTSRRERARQWVRSEYRVVERLPPHSHDPASTEAPAEQPEEKKAPSKALMAWLDG